MVHVIKVYFDDGKGSKQIRRVAVNSEIVERFYYLGKKIRELFPVLAKQFFHVTWKDSENDVIHMSSDEELAQALANADDGLLRIYVFTPDVQHPTVPKMPDANKSLETHFGVVCDACEEVINGHRYKCLQCKNYDLCSSCNAANYHADHDMIKLVKPSYVRREWVFLGAHKLYRSMFGKTLSRFAPTPFKENSIDPGQSPTNDAKQWQNLFNDFLAPAETILKNFVENVAGIDVKVENCPFKPHTSQVKPKLDESVKKDTGEKFSPEVKVSPLTTEVVVEKNGGLDTLVKEVNVEKKVEPAEEKKVPKDAVIKSNAEITQETSSSSSEICGVASTPSTNPSLEKHNKIVEEAKEKLPTSYEMFCEAERSANADGWTFVLDHEALENATGDTSTEISSAESKKEAIYPDITETLQSDETPKGLFGENLPEVAKQTNTVVTDPEILNSLKRMQAMGFNNEGGWLERLLITKNGNINDALDALYPNSRRR